MKPSLGRIVIALVPAEYNNGSTEAPAIITRVWNDYVVNLRILVDGPGEPLWRTSVTLYGEKPEDVAEPGMPKHSCWWPPKVAQ